MNEIIDFINRRWSIDCKWHDGNCWWFAYILITRFPEMKMYYLPKIGHFVAGLSSSQLFDHRGIYETDEEPILVEKIKEQDTLWYEHLMRDCFM